MSIEANEAEAEGPWTAAILRSSPDEVSATKSGEESPQSKGASRDHERWPHAPPHWLMSPGIYFVTASTLHKARFFDTVGKLDLVTRKLLDTAKEFGWQMRAWAVLANHYHFVADSPEGGAETLRRWLTDFHRTTAIALNQLDRCDGRRIWFNFRDTHITHQTSYLARLPYVHENPVRHKIVAAAHEYRWCSAAWFETNAPASFVASVARFKTDKLKIDDDY
jgi:putative transposase